MADSIWYVYGVVPSAFTIAGVPSGVEESVVSVLPQGDVAAVVSQLDREQYGAGALETSTGDVHWIGTRAVAHDRVLTWLSDRVAVVPFPMLTIFSHSDAVRDMLSQRARELGEVLARVTNGREYALRVYRVDSELTAKVGEVSPAIRALEESLEAAAPGQRYLLQRKLEAERKTEARRMSQELATEVYTSLSAKSSQGARLAIAQQAATVDTTSASGTLVLNAAFLVNSDGYPAFQRALSELVERLTPLGLRFDFTGPWPAYHFASP